MNKFTKLQTIVVPHVIKVALFLVISGGLTALLNGVGDLHLSPTVEFVVMGLINVILAGIKKWQSI